MSDMIAEAASDPHRFAVRLLADYPNDAILLVHRAADGSPEWHETQADVFFVQSGSAILVVGGELINGETVSPHENGMDQFGVECAARSLQEISCGSHHACHTSCFYKARQHLIISS